MKNRFTEAAEKVLTAAQKSAGLLGHTYIGSEHLLLGLLEVEEAISSRILRSKGLNLRLLTEAVAEYAGLGSPSHPAAEDMTPRARRIIEKAEEKTSLDKASLVGSEHILLALLDESDSVACRMILSESVSVGELKSEVTAFLSSFKSDLLEKSTDSKAENSRLPFIGAYGKDLTEEARRNTLDPVIGREGESARLIQVLSRRKKNNPCLIGEPGVGKTAVVEGLASKIAASDVPEPLIGTRIISLDLSAMIAGAKYRGEFEERLKGVLEELRKNPDILLFIDEIHMLSGAGAAEGAIDAANILKPALARGELRLIGATTHEEYRKHIESDSALERRFQPVIVREPTKEESVRILTGLLPRYEQHHSVKITEEAVRHAVELSSRYITDRFLPDKAIDLLDEAASAKRIAASKRPTVFLQKEKELRELLSQREKAIRDQNFEEAIALREKENALRRALKEEKIRESEEKAKSLPILTEEDISRVLTEMTGIPLYRLTEETQTRLSCMEEDLSQSIIGQSDAINALSAAIRRSMAGLRDPERPIGSFLFLGPSGVGKTALARMAAEVIFGSPDALIRLDMSEYMEAYSTSKLIGSAPGYVGFEDGGRLTDAVRKRPYSLILFDEIEKAHPDVYNLLLQILEDGNLTDSHGRHTDFSNTVIVITSNLIRGLDERKSIGFLEKSSGAAPVKRKSLEEKLRLHFRPELINRIDEILLFRNLDRTDIKAIAKKMLTSFSRFADQKGIRLTFDTGVTDYLAARAAEEENGARPLRRLITELVENRFSELLLSGKIKSGDRITARMEKDIFVLESTVSHHESGVSEHSEASSQNEPPNDTVAFRERIPPLSV